MSLLLEGSDCEQALLERCRIAAANNQGDALLKSRRASQQADEQDEVPAGEVPANHWHIYCARMIIALKRNIIRDLSDEKLISYMVEFCERPMSHVPGCCYNDYCVEYPNNGSARQAGAKEIVLVLFGSSSGVLKAQSQPAALQRWSDQASGTFTRTFRTASKSSCQTMS